MKLVPIESLNPSTYNPRTADPRRLDLIELSLRKLGFLLPIYATPDGEIISGHQRHHVATRMGVKQVPVAFTRAMDLAERKGVNVAFNRATNDLEPGDTPENITEALQRVDLEAISAQVPDKQIDTPEFYPCMHAQKQPLGPFLKANKGCWILIFITVIAICSAIILSVACAVFVKSLAADLYLQLPVIALQKILILLKLKTVNAGLPPTAKVSLILVPGI